MRLRPVTGQRPDPTPITPSTHRVRNLKKKIFKENHFFPLSTPILFQQLVFTEGISLFNGFLGIPLMISDPVTLNIKNNIYKKPGKQTNNKKVKTASVFLSPLSYRERVMDGRKNKQQKRFFSNKKLLSQPGWNKNSHPFFSSSGSFLAKKGCG